MAPPVQRVREDGRVFCPRCAARGRESWLPRKAFSKADNRVGCRSYCKRCNSEHRRDWYHADPERAAEVARRARAKTIASGYNRRMKRVYRARERTQREATKAELRDLASSAVAWLLSRGLRVAEIGALAGVGYDTIWHWRHRTGRPVYRRGPAERVIALLRVAGDLPPWPDRRRGEGHPWLDILAARMEQEAA